MRRSYVLCPYCNKETALQGIDMHVKSQHPEKYAEYRKNYDALKKTAVRKEISTKQKKAQAPAPAPGPAAKNPEVTVKPPKKVHLSRKPTPRSSLPAPPPPVEPPAGSPTPPPAGPVEPGAPGGEAPSPGQGAPQKSFLDEASDAILDWINTP